MDLRKNELARRDAAQLTYATDARRAVWTFAGLATVDGHRLDGAWSFSIAVPADVHDRRMVAEVLMHDRDVLLTSDATRHFEPALMRAAQAHFAAITVADALSEPAADRVTAVFAKACQTIAFACGLEILPPFTVQLTSPTLAAAKARADERARAEVDAADRAAHLRRATELSNAIATSTSISPGFLETIAPADRAAALGATLAVTAGRAGPAAPLYAVAGATLLRIDLTKTGAAPTTTSRAAAADIGALRCVQMIGLRQIAIGGQRGVELVDRDSPDRTSTAYVDDQSTSPLGFNAVARLAARDELWATHSQNGAVCWRLGDSTAPLARHAAFVGAGGLVALGDDALAFFAGTRVYVATAEGVGVVLDAGDDVVAIIPDGGRVHVLCEAGTWTVMETGTWRVADRRPTGGRITAATGMRWLGGTRMLLARREGSIDCLGVDDTVATRYASRHVGPRAVAASATHVAALTADRQRVLVWSAIDGRDPIAEVNVAALTGHRAAGIAFG
jgi:hypothetical protein